MGSVSVANLTDANAVFTNPAALGAARRSDLVSMYSNLAEDTSLFLVAGALPAGTAGAAGLGILNAQVGGLVNSSRDPITGRIVPGAIYNYTNTVYVLSYGREYNSTLSFGAGLNLFQEMVGGTSGGTATGSSLTFGLLNRVSPQLSVGLVGRNWLASGLAWSTGTLSQLPVITKLGISYAPRDWLTVALDGEYQSFYPLLYHLGLEWWPRGDILQIRLGADQLARSTDSVITNLGAGIGLSFAGISFDYAYTVDNEFTYSNIHYFSLGLGKRTNRPEEAARPAAVETKASPVTVEAKAISAETEVRARTTGELVALRTKSIKLRADIEKLNSRLASAKKRGQRKEEQKLIKLISEQKLELKELEKEINSSRPVKK